MGVHMAMGGWKKDSSPSGLHPSKRMESQAAMSETPRPLSPQEFDARMKACESGDIERQHAEADDLMCELLENLGYQDGIARFRAMYRWYA